MSLDGLKLNMSGAESWNSGSGKMLPEGRYNAKVTEAHVYAKDNKHPSLCLQLTVQDGSLAGSYANYFQTLSEGGRNFVLGMYETLGIINPAEIGEGKPLDTEVKVADGLDDRGRYKVTGISINGQVRNIIGRTAVMTIIHEADNNDSSKIRANVGGLDPAGAMTGNATPQQPKPTGLPF